MFIYFDCFLYFTKLNNNNQSFLACLSYLDPLSNVQQVNIDKVSFFFIAILIGILCSPTDSSKWTCGLDYLPVDYLERLSDQVLGVWANSVWSQTLLSRCPGLITGRGEQAHTAPAFSGNKPAQSFQGLLLRISCHGWSKKGMFACRICCSVTGGGGKIRLHLRGKW